MRDKISVIVPIYNEAKVIEKTINSLSQLETNSFDVEFLLVDGMSTDGTRDIISAMALKDPRIRLLSNPRRKTPFAMNIGLKEATGNYVAILGAHCKYSPDYLDVCLAELKRTGAVGCSGRSITQPHHNSFSAKVPYWVMGSAFGVSGNSYRTQKEDYVDTVPYPVFRRDVLVGLGGYNEHLHRNQDNDMNQRIRQAGHKLFYTWKTYCYYYAPGSINALLHYGYRNGYWNAISLKLSPDSMGIRHILPAFFSGGIVIFLVSMLVSLLLGASTVTTILAIIAGIGAGIYILAGLASAVSIAIKDKDIRALILPLYFFLFHFLYGWGTLWGMLKNAGKKSAGELVYS